MTSCHLSADAGTPADAPVLDVLPTPHDSLGDRGFFIFATVTRSLVAAIDLCLFAFGYWVIALFFVVDGMLLVAARLLCRRTRRRSERVVISGGSVRISRYREDRLIDQKRLPVFGLSIEREGDPDFGCQRVSLVLRGKRYNVAADQAPREREQFFDQLAQALETAGGSPPVRRIEPAPLLAALPSYAR